ncbi:MAG: glycosyltransferase family 2 protein [Planctomyces sp.]|nr:glycosyltransferase family 2 protein [Planctomyces sp.]
MSNRYVLITPCRNEAEFARRTLDSVCAQTIPPALWVIVDDGSTDETPSILAEYAAKFGFIRIVRREDRGKRAVGPGVIEAFYAGLDMVDLGQFDFLCKLDLDLDLPLNYFESLMARMHSNPRLGTCSGKPYYVDPKTGELISEGCGDDTSIGASKFYRVTCFQQNGGFVRQVMWDGIDCHRCRINGWIACSWDDPEIRFIHLRPMGSSQQNILVGRMRWGFGQYFMGTGPLYMAASAVFRMKKRPYVIGGLCMMWGYVRSWLRRETRYEDESFRKFLRRYQWRCLVHGKKKAMEMTDAEQASAFQPN